MLEVSLRKVKSAVALDLSGSIDIDSAVFIERVGWCLEQGYEDILCNMENVNFVDYSGISVLAIAYKNVLNHNGRLKFVNVPAHIKKLLSLVCMDKVFQIYADEESAVSSLEEDRVMEEIKNRPLRRRFKRLDLDIDIRFRRAAEESFHNGKLLNLSAVGVLIFTEEKAYPIGEVLEMELLLSPKPGLLKVQGKVIRLVDKQIQPQIFPGMGVAFEGIGSDTQAQIIGFIDRNMAMDGAG